MTHALQVWRLTPPCAFGSRAIWSAPVHAAGWVGPHHCFFCMCEVERLCALPEVPAKLRRRKARA